MKTILFATLALTVSGSALGLPTYIARIELPVPGAARAAAGDLDGDGVADVAAVSETTPVLYVFYGRGDGTFRLPPEAYPTDSSPSFVALGDLTSDGLTALPDILVLTSKGRVASPPGNRIDGDLAIYHNSGATPGAAGRFANLCPDLFLDGTGAGNGNQPSFAVLDRIDQDGLLDIVATSPAANTVQVLFQSYTNPSPACALGSVCTFGFANLPACTPVATGNLEPRSLAVGRFAPRIHNFPDVVTLGRGTLNPNPYHVRFHQHTGPDQEPLSTRPGVHDYLVGDGIGSGLGAAMMVADLLDNLDTLPDLLIADADSAEVSVLDASPNGNAATAIFRQPSIEFPANLDPVWVATGEVTAGTTPPGARDAVVANRAADQVSVLPGTGASPPGFLLPLCYPAGADPRTVAVARTNADALDDLLVVNGDAESVSVLLGRSIANGGFDVAPRRRTGGNPIAVARGDFDGDGRLDAGFVNGDTSTAGVLLGQGDGRFEEVYARASLSPGSAPIAAAAARLDAGASDDLVVLSDTPGRVDVLLAVGGGHLRRDQGIDLGADAAALVAARFGSTPSDPVDLAVTLPGAGRVVLFNGVGDGTFQPAPNLSIPGTRPTWIVAGDFDAAPGTDLVIVDAAGGRVQTLQNLGGSFSPGPTTPIGSSPVTGIAAGNLDGDGRADLIVTQIDGKVTALVGDGAGGFSARTPIAVGFDPVAPLVGELDGVPGRDALVVLASANAVLTLPWDPSLLPAGNLSLGAAVAYGTGRSPVGAVAGGFDAGAAFDTVVVADSSLPDEGFGATVLSGRRIASYPPADAGPDRYICRGASVPIGSPAKPYVEYGWMPPATLDRPTSAQPMASPTSDTTYTITVTNPQTGLVNTDTVSVKVLAPFPVTITPNPASTCAGQPPIVLDAGPGYLSYDWMPGGEKTRTIAVTVAGDYSVTVTTAAGAGCPGTGTRRVDVGTPATLAADVPPVRCQASPATMIPIVDRTVPPPGTTLTRVWSLPGAPAGWSIADPVAASTTVSVTSPPAVRTAILRLTVTTSPGGCAASLDFPLEVLAPGALADVRNTLQAVKTATGLDLSWSGSGASSYEARRVVTPAGIPTIFTLGTPVASTAMTTASIAETNPMAFYQVRGQCP